MHALLPTDPVEVACSAEDAQIDAPRLLRELEPRPRSSCRPRRALTARRRGSHRRTGAPTRPTGPRAPRPGGRAGAVPAPGRRPPDRARAPTRAAPAAGPPRPAARPRTPRPGAPGVAAAPVGRVDPDQVGGKPRRLLPGRCHRGRHRGARPAARYASSIRRMVATAFAADVGTGSRLAIAAANARSWPT